MKLPKSICVIVLSLMSFSLVAQTDTVTFGAMTDLIIGGKTKFYFGGNTGFGGDLTNNGTIISYGNLNFLANDSVGKLGFVGSNDQTIYGGEIIIDSLGVDKDLEGKVAVKTEQIVVSGTMNVINGAIETEEIDDLIVTGSSGTDGDGYVLGKLVGLTTGSDLTFPMGIEVNGQGFKNYITLSNTSADDTVIVDCLPIPAGRQPISDEMIGIADEVEWLITTTSGSTEATISVDFSGLDFINFGESNSIRARQYEPALVVFQSEDTIFQILESAIATPSIESPNEVVVSPSTTELAGSIVGSTRIMIDTDTTRIAVAWVPVATGSEFFVPNAFSPAGFYEENRVFRPFFSGAEIISISMRVFSAYNEEVYSYQESGNNLDISLVGWDGNLRGGQPAEAGVYYYSIKIVVEGEDDPFVEAKTVLLVK